MSTEKSIESSTSLFPFVPTSPFLLSSYEFSYLSNDVSPHGEMMHLLRKHDDAPLHSAMMRCLPINISEATSSGEAVIIGGANIICRRQTSFKKDLFCPVDKRGLFAGAGSGTRTHTVSLPTDFESVTSANSIIPANAKVIIHYLKSKCKRNKLIIPRSVLQTDSPL